MPHLRKLSDAELVTVIGRNVRGDTLDQLSQEFGLSKQAISERMKKPYWQAVRHRLIQRLIEKATDDIIEDIRQLKGVRKSQDVLE